MNIRRLPPVPVPIHRRQEIFDLLTTIFNSAPLGEHPDSLHFEIESPLTLFYP
ncbi:hypothetical protein DFP95_13315 [Cohnella lupini]|uniref:Uncharacterized protein n=1 Tax=Cohnella lupini TaxID=1294267 RepID=A0A3D9HT08_9BACL|nr:hypothetical protein DFP95_13315 [Cohnella lupini]